MVTVTRSDLAPAQQAVQSAHAAIDFCFQHPNKASPWNKESNYLVMLAVNSQKQLELLIEKCKERFIEHSVFTEPDIGNEITAVALEPSPSTQRLVRNIPLMLKTEKNESI